MTTQVDNVFSPEQAYIDWTQYARGRAPYQKRMFDIIYDYHSKGGAGWDLVIDHGAGDCTLAPFLLQRFKHVEATDASEAQLKIGEERLRKAGIDETRLTIRTCPAGSNPGPDASADMVTAATCVHFFDIPAFLTDAARLLKPGGTLAIFTSGGIPVIIDRDQSGMTKLSATGEMLMEWFSKTVMTELARLSPKVASQLNIDKIAIPPVHFEAEMRYDLGAQGADKNGYIKLWNTSPEDRKFGKDATVVKERPQDPRKAIVYRNDVTFEDLDRFIISIGRAKGEGRVPWIDSQEWKTARAEMVKMAGGEHVKMEAVYPLTMLLARKKKA